MVMGTATELGEEKKKSHLSNTDYIFIVQRHLALNVCTIACKQNERETNLDEVPKAAVRASSMPPTNSKGFLRVKMM